MDLGQPTLPLWEEEGILETSSAKPEYVLGKVSASSGQESEILKGPSILSPPLMAADALGTSMCSPVVLQPQVPWGMKWVQVDRAQDL